ncbi:MAG TPA: HAMP domain-containing sensor histidine kinase [Bdellovibrionota bacterium]|nr:HAMP domain-containing sensor histidine kinase [Bdellovibrionota bacterium]
MAPEAAQNEAKVDAAGLDVLILAPTGQDATLLAKALRQEGISAVIFSDIDSLCFQIRRNAGAVLIAEEAFTSDVVSSLKSAIQNQEPWSDIPIIIMVSPGRTSLPAGRILRILAPSGNVTLLERPFHPVTLVSMVMVALRARSRQYQVLNLLNLQERATKDRDDFISIASHELKTPLTSMKLQTELGLRMTSRGLLAEELPEKLTRLLRSNHTEVDKLVRLVDDMLDATRIVSGALTIRKSEFDLTSLVREIVEKFRPLLTNADCALHVDTNEAVIGTFDKFRIEQVLSNLLTNAARYAAGKPVWVSVCRIDDRVSLIVRDEGKGIPAEKREMIFERFKRAVAEGDQRGLGLGLFISRQIVRAHHGDIHVESQSGQGAIFIVDLPVHG